MKILNERFKKWNNMNVGEASHRISNCSKKQFHACDSNEMLTKTKTMLGKDNVHLNNNTNSLKSGKQYSYK